PYASKAPSIHPNVETFVLQASDSVTPCRTSVAPGSTVSDPKEWKLGRRSTGVERQLLRITRRRASSSAFAAGRANHQWRTGISRAR
ncbi:MAG TPA: hypothetical protein VIN06_04270, partial [Devosia sp.]